MLKILEAAVSALWGPCDTRDIEKLMGLCGPLVQICDGRRYQELQTSLWSR